MLRVFTSALLILATAGLSARSATDGATDLKAFYSRSCAACHGEDGSARGPNGQKLGGRDLANPRWQARTKDSDMVKAILKGKESMPAFESQLSEADALKLVTDILRPMAAKKH